MRIVAKLALAGVLAASGCSATDDTGSQSDASAPAVPADRDADVGSEPERAAPRDAAVREDGAAAGQPTLADPFAALAPALIGHWWGQGDTGDCLDLQDWYSFFESKQVVYRKLDRNACSGDRLLERLSGDYELNDGTLKITLDGNGEALPPDMLPTSAAVAKRSERMTIAIDEQPASATHDAQTLLDDHAFSSDDGASFESDRRIVLSDAEDATLFAQRVEITLQLSEPLPLAQGVQIDVHVLASLSQFDAEAGDDGHSDLIVVDYPAVIRAKEGWLRIVPGALDGLGDDDALDAWHQLLDASGFGDHPDWARRLFQAQFFPSQRFKPGQAAQLSSTLPKYGRWTRSSSPPPQL